MPMFFGPGSEPVPAEARAASPRGLHDLELPRGSLCWVEPGELEPGEQFGEQFGEHGVRDGCEAPAAMVRPYTWTGGRTRSRRELRWETLVSTSELGGNQAALSQVEHCLVAALCRHPHSMAEVAATLAIPLGVARVILSDMAELGLIRIHRTSTEDDVAAQLDLMERVLSGLRRL